MVGPQNLQPRGGPHDLQRLDRRPAVADLHDGERRRPHQSGASPAAAQIVGCFDSAADERRGSARPSRSSAGSSMACRLGRFDPIATSLAVGDGGAAGVGCARLIHQNISRAPATTPASADNHPAQERRPGGGGSGVSVRCRSFEWYGRRKPWTLQVARPRACDTAPRGEVSPLARPGWRRAASTVANRSKTSPRPASVSSSITRGGVPASFRWLPIRLTVMCAAISSPSRVLSM